MIVNRQELIAAFTDAVSATTVSTAVPVLRCVRISCDGARLHVEGRDLVQYACHEIIAENMDRWQAIIPATYGAKVVTALSGENVRLEDDGDRLTMSDGKTTVKIPHGCPAEDWPHFATPIGYSVAIGGLCGAVARVGHACGTDSARTWMMGVTAFSDDNDTYVVGTDGKRLAAHLLDSGPLAEPVILMPETVRYMTRRMPPTADVSIWQESSMVSANNGRLTYWAKLHDGAPANMLPIITAAQNAREVCELHANAIIDQLRRALLMADEPNTDQLQVTIASDGMTVASESYTGSARDAADVRGEALSVTVNGRYLLDALAAIGQGPVTVRCDGPDKPVSLVTPEHVEIIMPVNKGR